MTDPPGRRILRRDAFTIELDLSTQVLAVDVPEDLEWAGPRHDHRVPIEAPLSATLGSIDRNALVSASVLAQKAKIFDDGLYAAVEVAAQEGLGRHAGKAALLASLARALGDREPSASGIAQNVVLGAARLGRVPVTSVPSAVEASARGAVDSFLSDALRSKPVGFYTWSPELGSIFQQDRMLQTELDAAGAATIASALRADPPARATYERHLHLIARLTNRLAHPDLRSLLDAQDPDGAAKAGARFFPASVAHETELAKKLLGDLPIPDDFVLADAMIDQIRTRRLDLEPRADSGWYDYQTWALEPLVIPERMPEASRLLFHDEYKALLLELFKGLLTLTRETHVKQLEFPTLGMSLPGDESPVLIAPALSAEPLVTFYLRRALGYRYVRSVLEDAFGAGELSRIRRLSESGPVRVRLADELLQIEMLFLGAHARVSRELGLALDTAVVSETAARGAEDQFASWARDVTSDADLKRDLRAMVPLFKDEGRGTLKVWLFLGWARRPVTVSFARRPEVTVRDRRGNPLPNPPRLHWHGLHVDLPYPVTAELNVSRLLDRDAFRRLCDSCGTRAAIVRSLEA